MLTPSDNVNTMAQQINALYQKVSLLEYSNTSAILQTLSEVERMEKRYHDSTELLILMTRLQIMNSQEQRAKFLARRVWEVGGNISPIFEKMYLDDLINLGLTDMAAILVQSKLEDIETNIKIFPLELLRFALLIGNVPLIKRICRTIPDNALFKALAQFADNYQQNNYNVHFQNISRIVTETVAESICGYDFNFYINRGVTDVEIVLYFSNYDFNLKKHSTLINNKIDGYCLTSRIARANNLSFVCRHIKDRPML